VAAISNISLPVSTGAPICCAQSPLTTRPSIGASSAGALELRFAEGELRLGLMHVGRRDRQRRRVALGHRLAQLVRRLVALAAMLVLLELELAVVDAGEHLAANDALAGAHQRLRDEALERRRDDLADAPFDGQVGGDAVSTGQNRSAARPSSSAAAASFHARWPGWVSLRQPSRTLART
jgi:hypothetical protein